MKKREFVCVGGCVGKKEEKGERKTQSVGERAVEGCEYALLCAAEREKE